jgi:hypothetical protein
MFNRSSSPDSRCVGSPARSMWWSLVLMLTFGWSAETPAQEAKKAMTPLLPRLEATQTGNNQGAIEAESRRLAAKRIAGLQKLERELIAKSLPAQTKSDELWRGFRQTFLFHNQVVALSEPAADGSRTLIVSEPPPHVGIGDILAAVGDELLLSHQVKKHSIGFDGWVKDLTMAVKGNDEELREMLSRLHQRLFFTSYHSQVLKLPASARELPMNPNLNLKVTPEELKRWVVDEGEQFFPLESGKTETLASLASETASGVYLSKRRGLIGWWIPKARHIYECRVQARQFSLDADLIVGAIANSSGILVLGRERVVPVDILPPLRVETLVLLADVQQGQNGALFQSYERRHDFAGRIGSGYDWAPILLSPELRDTEYGSLLNITDQLLKGWSNYGQTQYINFPYPKPREYPFPGRVNEVLKAKGYFTYNWNTKGAGYAVDYGRATIMALNRTGSLPVSYIPEGAREASPAVSEAENRAYDRFSQLSDVNLVRVVQYAAMYQIFSAFGIAHSFQRIPKDEYPGELIESLTKSLYAEVRQASDEDLRNWLKQIQPMILTKEMLTERMTLKATEAIEAAEREIKAELRKLGYQPGSQRYTEEFDRRLAARKVGQVDKIKMDMIEFYRDMTIEIAQQLDAIKLDRPALTQFETSLRARVLSSIASIKQLPERYAQAIDSRARGWIHTPVVVMSKDKTGRYVGGHNLDARVTKVVTDRQVPLGQVMIDLRKDVSNQKQLVLLINPQDASRARGLARAFERKELARQLAHAVTKHNGVQFEAVRMEMNRSLANAETTAVRPRETALGLGAPPPPRGPQVPPTPDSSASWSGRGRNPLLLITKRRDHESIRVELSSDGRYNLEYGTADPQRSFGLKGLTHEDMIDVAALEATRRSKDGQPVIIEFENVPEHKAVASLQTMETRLAQRSQPVELVGFRSAKGDPMARARITRWQETTEYRIGFSEIETTPNGRLRQEIAVEAKSPASSTRFNIRMLFDGSTPRQVIREIFDRILKALDGMRRQFQLRSEGALQSRQVARAIKKIKTRTNVDFEFSVGEDEGLRDIYIGQKGRRDGESASFITTSLSE